MFESIAKTNTTHTLHQGKMGLTEFESIAKTNTTHTRNPIAGLRDSLRVLLKQIQHTQCLQCLFAPLCLRVLLKQIQHTQYYPRQKQQHV